MWKPKPARRLQSIFGERLDGLANAIMAGDVDTFCSYYTEDITFCDWTHNARLVGKAKLRLFFQDIFSKLAPITLHNRTVSVNSPLLILWAFEKRSTVIGAMPHLERVPGQRVKKRACLVQHRRHDENKDGTRTWRTWKENDYGQRDQDNS